MLHESALGPLHPRCVLRGPSVVGVTGIHSSVGNHHNGLKLLFSRVIVLSQFTIVIANVHNGVRVSPANVQVHACTMMARQCCTFLTSSYHEAARCLK